MNAYNEEDPLVSYIIVRESLNMSVGKIGAQIGHGVQNLLLNYFKIQLLSSKKIDLPIPERMLEQASTTTEWLAHKSRKIIKKADEKEWAKVKNSISDLIIIKDAGLTEVMPDSETVICLWPMLKSSAPKEVTKLQNL